MTVAARIAAIFTECGAGYGVLGFAQRGVASWDQEKLITWYERPESLSPAELEQLAAIERQVFGSANVIQVATA